MDKPAINIRQRNWPSPINILGQRFEGWTVIGSKDVLRAGAGRGGKSKLSVKWLCRCDCGFEKYMHGFELRNGRSRWCKSCSRTKDSASTPAHSVMKDYQRAALRRGIEWGLSFEQFVQIISSDCFYTGRKPSQIRTLLSGKSIQFNGIDRLDSSKGYVPGNCVACCSEVNKSKIELGVSEFLALIEEIHQHMGGLCRK